MSLDALADQLAPALDRARLAELHKRLPASAPADWRALAAVAALALPDKRCIGLSGAQGTGKSTLAALIEQAITLEGRRSVACSLDNFYLNGRRRKALAVAVHPLMATRGPPGTHDLGLALDVVHKVLAGARAALPRFDKGRDEPVPASQWPVVEQVRTLVFEGWCLGVQPQPEAMLTPPVNALEAEEDPLCLWRRHVNGACTDYGALWRLVDWWIYLDAPDMEAVRRWRAEQEAALPAAQRMDAAALDRFVAHYERLTGWQQQCFAPQADWRFRLDRKHRLTVQK